jgi:phosphoadenosine phosphosulfate reductase
MRLSSAALCPTVIPLLSLQTSPATMSTYPVTQTSSIESSPRLRPASGSFDDDCLDTESGYGSATSSTPSLPQVTLTPAHLRHLNKQFEKMSAEDILRSAKVFFPNLYQSTAFGLTGLVTLDMLSKIQEESRCSSPVDLIFLDTLYHFKETHELVDRIKARYPKIHIHTFKPDGFETTEDFEAMYGGPLYELSEEMYDYTAKVEPLERAYRTLGVTAVLTGRRRSQGGKRDDIQVIEMDEERGVIKINPLVNWSFADVKAYIDQHNVPYNALLDRGYKSVGDWHSTSPVAEGEDERAGRWKGRSKTECGIHNRKSRYTQFQAAGAVLNERDAEEQVAKRLKSDAAAETLIVESTVTEIQV